MSSRHVWFGGRRRGGRRAGEQADTFVDQHGPGLFATVVVIVALNLLDAWFTLLFLSHGGHELNPLVQRLLEMEGGPWPFVLVKTVGIGLCVAFLALTKNFRPARIGMAVVLVGYTALLGWHLYLLSQLPLLAH